ncbi:MAG: hypothetical protein JNK27_16885 [Chitinophagaceae bacterium]|nr:hypothetical protein [Chitinophagaceae bacterium]
MNATNRPFLIKFTNADEIRMGSPFNSCDIEIVGYDKIKLPKGNWQDKYAWTDDSKKLLLIKWNFENNEPGFHLFLIDIETGQKKESLRLVGLPTNISLIDDKIKISKFLYDKEKSVAGKLCCEIEEEFEFDK